MAVGDTGFEIGGDALTQNFHNSGFWPELTLEKVKFVGEKGRGARPRIPSKFATIWYGDE